MFEIKDNFTVIIVKLFALGKRKLQFDFLEHLALTKSVVSKVH